MNVANIETSASRRDKIDILVNIIGIARRGATKTRIMYQANMNSAGINEYLSFLLETKLLTKTYENNKRIYRSTEKGLSVLELYSQLSLLINENKHNRIQAPMPPYYILAR
jgi:predicted transcriptional regulator